MAAHFWQTKRLSWSYAENGLSVQVSFSSLVASDLGGKAPIENDVVFCRTLLNSNVLVVPGRGFGTPGYFRISYCVEDWVLEGAVKGFAEAMAAPEG